MAEDATPHDSRSLRSAGTPKDVSVRPIRSLDEAKAAAELLDRVWEERRVIGSSLLWVMASHGGQVLAAFREGEIVGTQVGVVGLIEGRPTLHSHITGVLPDEQHHGVGLQLKLSQREWCLERGIDRVTWTFDPMVARNAYFNLVKLGVVTEGFGRNYYGEMQDGFNRGDRSDRLEVSWKLESQRVRKALGFEKQDEERSDVGAIPILVQDTGGRPETHELDRSAGRALIAVPEQYHAMRAEDPERAAEWREAVGAALETAFHDGLRPISFVRHSGYILERS